MTGTSMPNRGFVQYGCGLSCPAGWVNYDCSPQLRLERLPVFGRFFRGGPHGRFPEGVLYGDIVTGLPRPAGSAELLYCSHVLEHLTLDDLRRSLRNSHRLLATGGVFRIVLPDLEQLIHSYQHSTAEDRGVTFIRDSLMGMTSRPRGGMALIRQAFGNSHHLWLWDYSGLAKELSEAGFLGIRRAEYNDSGIEGFSEVESEDRWRNALGIQCTA